MVDEADSRLTEVRFGKDAGRNPGPILDEVETSLEKIRLAEENAEAELESFLAEVDEERRDLRESVSRALLDVAASGCSLEMPVPNGGVLECAIHGEVGSDDFQDCGFAALLGIALATD